MSTATEASLAVTVSFAKPLDTGTGNADFNVSQYQVEVSSTLSFAAIVQTNTLPLLAIPVANLLRGVMYYFRVKAITLAGTGAASAPVLERVVGVSRAPLFPLGVKLVAPTDLNELTVSWRAPLDQVSLLTNHFSHCRTLFLVCSLSRCRSYTLSLALSHSHSHTHSLSRCLALYLSAFTLSFSLSRCLALARAHTHGLSRCPTLYRSITLSHPLTPSLTPSIPHSRTHPFSQPQGVGDGIAYPINSYSVEYSLSSLFSNATGFSVPAAHSVTRTTLAEPLDIEYTGTHSLTPPQPHNPTSSLPHSLTTSLPHNPTPSQPHSPTTPLPHSPTPSLPHSIPFSLAHTLTPSLPLSGAGLILPRSESSIIATTARTDLEDPCSCLSLCEPLPVDGALAGVAGRLHPTLSTLSPTL